ncbi:lipoyl(octanoyl) transferase LipB [Parvibium lacunae]|uniref:lipoyl(octanoyl) transferase LipB n=1 Tax=Parvibium lacunae TaxID=1888893 RepID=UPI001EFE5BA6|nr:lipoyl(octanoyl) transferase LipB [Parvibium lacunae]
MSTPPNSLPSTRVYWLGLQPYADCFERMQAFTAARQADTPDEIWVVEHPPVFTLGLAGNPAHLLQTTEIPLVQVDRGGQITYHGPGQLVIYLLLDLRRRRLFVRDLVWRMEQALLDCLAAYGLAAERKAGAPGVYVPWQGELAKIAALGIKVRNQCTYHGLALNIAMDLQPFTLINPCGYAGLQTVDMRQCGVTATREAVAQRLLLELAQQGLV